MPHRERDSVERFADRVVDYAKYRPTYPPGAIDAVLDGLGPADHLRAADVGAGTGISARLIADRGVPVVAVEPGADMRQAAARHPGVTWLAARAERTALRSATLDLVVCAQSFHWFRVDETLREFARILKPGGRVALVWNRRSQTDPLTVAYRQAIVEAGADMTVERMTFDPEVVSRDGVFSAPVRRSFPHAQHLDRDGLIGRARSASYVPTSGPMAERLHQGLRALYERHHDAGGAVTLVYETEVYLSRKV